MSRFHVICCCALAVCCALASSSAGAAGQQTPDERAYDTLKEPATLEFVETPLTDACDTIKEKHKIDIQFDKRAMENAGVGTDTPITKNLRGIALGAALRLLLDDMELTYVVRDGILMITTPEAALRMADTRVYDVSQLTNVAPVHVSGTPMPWVANVQLANDVKNMLVYRRNCQFAGKIPQGIAEPVVSAFGKTLIVNASWPEQHVVSELLAELSRKAGSSPTAQTTAARSTPPSLPGRAPAASESPPRSLFPAAEESESPFE